MPWAAVDRYYLPQQLGATGSEVGGLGCCTTEDVEERVLFSRDRAHWQLVSRALRVRLRLGQLPAASGSRDGLAMGTGSGPGVSERSLPVPKISD